MPTNDKSQGPSDALIVGAGVIGLSIAWRAAQAGLDVAVLERSEPGSGASGVAAGMLAPVGEATWGEESLLELALASHALWPAFAAELASTGEDAGYRCDGALHIALDRDEAAELRRRFDLIADLGLDAEWLTPSEARRAEPGLTPSLSAAVSAPHEAAVDPQALVRRLTEACRREGVEIRTGLEATRAVIAGERLAGVSDQTGGEHRAGLIVYAAGVGSAAHWLPAEAMPSIRPVKGQILTLGARHGERVCAGIVTGERFYAVPRGDRLIVGASVEEAGLDPAVTAGAVHELLRTSRRALPEIDELELIEARVGFRPATPDNLPLIGRSAVDGLIVATGHFRNGVLLAPLTAVAVVDLIGGSEPSVDIGAADPARFGWVSA